MHFDGWTLALQTVNFAVLVWLLHRFLYKPVLRSIDLRKAVVQKEYDDAKAAEDKAKAYLAKIESERTGIAVEREAALKDIAAQAQAAADARRVGAERDAQALLETTRKSLVTEREHAIIEIRQSAFDLGIDFAKRLLAEMPANLQVEAWIERIEQYLKNLPKTELDALTAESAGGGALTVVTAYLLPPETAETWSARLQRYLGNGFTIAFVVDSKLIAGVELQFPTAILRFSWQSMIETLRSEIGTHVDAH